MIIFWQYSLLIHQIKWRAYILPKMQALINQQLSKSLVKYYYLKYILDLLLWEVVEYRKLRIMKIYEKGKVIVVLIKSNTKLEHTIDNVLGYYFESDDDDDDDDSETPKSLF